MERKETCSCRTCESNQFWNEKPRYCLSILDPKKNLCSNDIHTMLECGRIDDFIDAFLAGLAQQITTHTGSDRPIGEAMANRIRNDLAVALHQVGKIAQLQDKPTQEDTQNIELSAEQQWSEYYRMKAKYILDLDKPPPRRAYTSWDDLTEKDFRPNYQW